MRFNPETYELEYDDEEINEERRIFLINSGKLSLSALLLAGFIPMEDAEANPLLIRVVVGAIRYFTKKGVKKVISKGVKTVNTISAIDTLSGGHLSASVRNLVVNKSDNNEVNNALSKLERKRNIVWRQNGGHPLDSNTNKVSIIIANNSGKTVDMPSTEIASIVDKRDSNDSVKLKLKKSGVKPGFTFLEAKITKLPQVGIKRIVPRQRHSVSTTAQNIIVATDKEVNDIIKGRNTASKLYEKYVTNIESPSSGESQYSAPKGVGTNLYKKYIIN